ncbi:hypothetical protein NDU88_001315 [Pleurodeles waltl]|uniref:Uncharacterized protein n=1 Tax=Pleurodeles waltl TaxID=8319 RepID=A0AAV7Q6P7_PLEWA|nr:hypothetical protein NDU88_001315 [Pleurodeles waltl]
MCRLELQEFPRSCEPRGGSNIGFGSPGALWDRAALELRRSQRAVAQALLRGKADRGRANTGEGWLSPGRLKAQEGEEREWSIRRAWKTFRGSTRTALAVEHMEWGSTIR